jgi:acetylornithine/N-succinyldiaminopimelate aminotransferase
LTRLLWYPGHDLLLTNVVRAENCRIFDAHGNEHVDLESGVWCASLGHGHPRILAVLATQSARISHTGFCYTHEVVEDAAREILSLLGFDGGRCVFLCSGSEAVEYGVRVARSLLDRPLLLTMADSYFGAYGSANRRSKDEWLCFDWTDCADCRIPGAACTAGCERWRTIPRGEIGGFLFEPGSSSGLVRFPPEKLIRSIVALVKETDGLVLVNEVTTGVGRTGRWFGYQHYGIRPDIVALGKGIGNGYPVSVAAVNARVAARLGDKPLPYSQSHQNDPLGAAVAREVVRVIAEDGLVERGMEIAAVLLAGLNGVKERTGRIREIRSRGLMAAIELVDGPDLSFTGRVHRALLRRGYIVGRRPGVPVLRLDPSLTIERADVEGFLETIEAVLIDARSGD